MGDLSFRQAPATGPLLARAAFSARGRAGASGSLPGRVARLSRLRQDVDRLAAYDRVCGFTLRDEVPPTWLHVLTFPLQVALMVEPDFPFALPGLVHASNRMTLHTPVRVTDELDLLVRADGRRPHAKGTMFDLVGEVRVGGRLAWSGVSTYLARHRAEAGAEAHGPEGERSADREGSGEQGPRPPEAEEITAAQRWRLPADLGRRYAAVSGDVNPIHLHPATARLFGFRRPIVHGMWTHARALAALEGRLPAAYEVGVRFTKTIPLPSTVRFGAREADGTTGFAVLGHLTGTVSPLA